MFKAQCKRSREIIVLKCYQLSAICELYQHQIFREVRAAAACCRVLRVLCVRVFRLPAP